MPISSSFASGLAVGFGACVACSTTHRDFGSADASGSGGHLDNGQDASSAGDNGVAGIANVGNGGTNGSAGAGAGGASGGTPAIGDGGAGGNATASGGAGAGGVSVDADGGMDTGGTAGAGGASTGGTSGAGGGGGGGTGGASCGALTTCGSACADLTSDGKNCGKCGHSCLGGICDTSTCQPVTIATGQNIISEIAVDGGTNVYWTSYTSSSGARVISRRRVNMTDAVHVLAGAETYPANLALSSTSLFWFSSGHLRVCNLPDCSSSPADLISTVFKASCGSSIVVAGGKLFWSCYSDYNTNNGIAYSLPVPLSTTTPTVVGPNPSNPGSMITDGTNVYWFSSSTYTNDNLNFDGVVWRARLSDGSTTQLVTQLRGDLGALAVGGGALFLAGNILLSNVATTNDVLRIPLPNGLGAAIPPSFAPARAVYSIVADSNYVYFSDSFNSTISRCAQTGCTTPEVIAPGQGGVLAQDSVSLYWGSSDGKILRLAK